MGNLSDLPNELIVEVNAFVKEHNELKSTFSFVNHCRDDIQIRPADTLKCLLLNPRSALYVRNVSIDGWRYDWDPADYLVPKGSRHKPYPKETMELFRQAIMSSPFVPDHNFGYWINELEKGDEAEVLALIVMRLPNVENFKLLHEGRNECCISRTIQLIAESQGTEAPSRLKEVQIGWGDETVSGDVDWLHIFSALPSVKAIEARNVGHDRDCNDPDCRRNRYTFDEDWDYSYDCHAWSHDPDSTLDPKTSNVTHLTFSNCEINTRRLLEFLEGLPALEYIDYLGAMDPSEPGEIISALLAHTNHSLQTLRLKTCNELHRDSYFTVDLAKFEVLKELEIESESLPLFKYASAGNKLAELLPPSIETIDFAPPEYRYA
ncbi:MAG: hypothetical protein ALECFALPRED_003434 [Alectoria fallacina]|uniref:Uncharacterized protein n=1 Tax=Alectoria fallacina TaxID=1903189 RepID=A0A8H3FP10_9LECA|nr:MAG: hypothetical protein ALECFALPRED_003434 [Alectoria fallacina]